MGMELETLCQLFGKFDVNASLTECWFYMLVIL
jgi:hypothetical protein